MLVYLWADGVYVKSGLDTSKAALLVLIGADADGQKTVLAVESGQREKTENWAAVLRNLKRRGAAGARDVADGWLQEAMPHCERAERMRPPGNDESILRWNACARLLNLSERLHPHVEEESVPMLE